MPSRNAISPRFSGSVDGDTAVDLDGLADDVAARIENFPCSGI